MDTAPETTRRVAMLGFEGLQILDVTGPLEVFSLASRLLLAQGRAQIPPYEVMLAARSAGPVASSSGLALVADRSWNRLGPVDTLLVSGGAGVDRALEDRELLAWLRREAPAARRYGSVCTGALLLARAGLLEGRRVTTHWAFLGALAEMVPAARIQPDAIFLRDGRLWTSAGVTAGMDMALAMVEEDWGRTLALEVAQQLVMYLKRPGRHSQLSATLAAQSAVAEGRFRDLMDWIFEHLEEDLSVAALAERMAMSPRHFSRSFAEETGLTPAKFVEGARFEAARRMLTDGEAGLETIALRCGFGSAETLRRVFHRRTGMAAAAYRLRLQRQALPDGETQPGAGL
ncbi:MAG TPA: DJ-1/PfpI family protein [Gammaproteobacteria bacterium]|nr:DJ-1/PfpI family protein [Gammaproteobacteria bacterium]